MCELNGPHAAGRWAGTYHMANESKPRAAKDCGGSVDASVALPPPPRGALVTQRLELACRTLERSEGEACHLFDLCCTAAVWRERELSEGHT